jgi:hypothetical protein
MIINPYIFAQSSTPIGSVPQSNLRIWLESTAGVVYNGSNLVNIWNDQTANNNDAIQSTTTYQPNYIALDPQLNNLPSVAFDGGTDHRMEVPFNAGTMNWSANGFSLYMVVNIQNFMSVNSHLIAHCDNAVLSQGWGIYYASNELTFWVGNWNNANQYVRIVSAPYNQKLLVKFTWNKSIITASYRTQAGSTVSGTKAFTGPYTNPSFNMGIMNIPGGNTFFDTSGKVGSIFVYNGVLSTQDDIDLQNYLKSKYAIL